MTLTRRHLTISLAAAAGVAAVALTSALPFGQGRGIQADTEHPVLAIGSSAPNFSLPGVDGKMHTLHDYDSAKVLAIIFECNHCPTSQLYEGRIRKLYESYRRKGVAFVAVNPNNPKSIRLDELGYTDVTDSLAEMKVRAAYRRITWPYLYDGDKQALANALGVVATPHIFIFDANRKLRYEGRIDDNQREDLVKSEDARHAIDALLADKPVPVARTRAFGCTTKWLDKASGVEEEWTKIEAEPVTLDNASEADLQTLRRNATDNVLLVHFWSTCPACEAQFGDLETTYRMYRLRAFNFVTVSTDPPAARSSVMTFLDAQHASGPNKLMTATDDGAERAMWGAVWKPGMPFTAVIGPGGKMLYQKAGKFDLLEVRRVILANLPDTKSYIGQKAYWSSR